MLKEAQKTGEEADVTIHWIHEDAARFSSQVSYDAAICICEGGFGLLGTADDPEEHDRAILDNIHACLIEKAGLILTVPNGLKKIRQFNQGDVQAGNFDPYYLLETFTVEWNTPEGSKSVQVKERGYTPIGLARLLEDVGFKVQGIYGGTAGRWALRKPELDEMELMAICQRI
jgi:hypothetical protein